MTQKEQIRDYLEKGNKITSLEALELFGCFRLASRISELRKEGMDIKSKTIKLVTGKYVSQYFIEGTKEKPIKYF